MNEAETGGSVLRASRETLHNARKGYLRVLYPYHPYYGQTLEVFGAGGGLREPAKYFVRVTKCEKRACKGCEEQGVQSAPLPAETQSNFGGSTLPSRCSHRAIWVHIVDQRDPTAHPARISLGKWTPR
jgi:hypothetical protein